MEPCLPVFMVLILAERLESVSGELRELGFFNSHGFGR